MIVCSMSPCAAVFDPVHAKAAWMDVWCEGINSIALT